jgi:hypothetical protein
MIPRVSVPTSMVNLYFLRHFSSFASRCETTILPAVNKPFCIRRMCEREDMELADALLENTSVTYLRLETEKYTKSSAEAMAKYLRTSKCLQRLHWNGEIHAELRHWEEILCCFLPAIQESTSLKELHITFPVTGGPSHLALENMLTHTQSLQSLSLVYPTGLLEDIAVAAARSGLRKNTTLRELKLEYSRDERTPHYESSNWNIRGMQRLSLPFLPVCATILSFRGYVCVGMW